MAACLAAVLVIAGCSSSGGKKAAQASSSAAASAASGSGSGANTPRLTVAMVTHSAPGDTFWDIVRKGAEAAAAKDNVQLNYSADPTGAKQAQLVQQAIEQKVGGIITTLAKPDAMKGVLAKAKQAGIPVMVINGGGSIYAQYGALSEFGQDESVAGQAAGMQLKQDGAKSVLCVVHEQGNVSLDQRCQGVRKTFDGKVQDVFVDGTNAPQVSSTLGSKLQADPSVDTLLTLSAPIAAIAVKATKDANSKARVATFDLNADVAQGLQDGSLEFAVDQQPYLQGYLGVDGLWLYVNNGDVIGGGQQVLTGPQIVTKADVAKLSPFIKAGTR